MVKQLIETNQVVSIRQNLLSKVECFKSPLKKTKWLSTKAKTMKDVFFCDVMEIFMKIIS